MRILTVLSTFPPHTYGGGENSALNLSKWLLAQGHEVAVITTADHNEQQLFGEMREGLRVWRLRFPRPYTFWNHVKASKWLKPFWYFQDHFAPKNRQLMGTVLDAYKPDIVTIHVPAGIGYNSLREIGNRNIPAVYFLHDLNLVCLWGGMFKNGKVCKRQCPVCTISSTIRFSAVTSIDRVGFCSPSRANLETARTFLPLDKYKTAAIFNANKYPPPTVKWTNKDEVRFAYVGRLSDTKGVSLLLTALEKLSDFYKFSIDLLGEGSESDRLRARFAHHKWCHFKGHVSQQDVANTMMQSDLLCVPSIWPENLPGVVIQALSLGLPVLGSDIGGIPELVTNEKNGLLIAPNDQHAWEHALRSILEDPNKILPWKANAEDSAIEFDQDKNGHRILAFMKEVIDGENIVETQASMKP